MHPADNHVSRLTHYKHTSVFQKKEKGGQANAQMYTFFEQNMRARPKHSDAINLPFVRINYSVHSFNNKDTSTNLFIPFWSLFYNRSNTDCILEKYVPSCIQQ